jgi:hypothetical protein
MRLACEAGLNWIQFDVPPDPIEFSFASPMVVGFTLPERVAGSTKNKVRLSGGVALEGLHDFRNGLQWSDQHVNVIRHDHVGVKLIVLQSVGGVK